MLTKLDLNLKLANLLAKLSGLMYKPVYFIANLKIINRFNLFNLITYVLAFLFLICPPQALFAESNSAPKNNNAQDNTGDLLVAEFAINNNDLPKALDIYEKIAIETKDPQVIDGPRFSRREIL